MDAPGAGRAVPRCRCLVPCRCEQLPDARRDCAGAEEGWGVGLSAAPHAGLHTWRTTLSVVGVSVVGVSVVCTSPMLGRYMLTRPRLRTISVAPSRSWPISSG